MLTARFTRRKSRISDRPSGRSSVVEHDLAKVGVEGSNPYARSSFPQHLQYLAPHLGARAFAVCCGGVLLG